jgi:hypothetical protein
MEYCYDLDKIDTLLVENSGKLCEVYLRALVDNREDVLKIYKKHNYKCETCDAYYMARVGNLEKVKEFIEKFDTEESSADCEFNGYKHVCICNAIIGKQDQIILYILDDLKLIANKEDFETACEYGNEILFDRYVGEYSNERCLKLLYNKGHIDMKNMMFEKILEKTDYSNMLSLFNFAVESGSIIYTKTILTKLKSPELLQVFQTICKNGNKELLFFITDNFDKKIFTKNFWNMGLIGACEGGHIELIKLMIENGAANYNDGLFSACRGGQLCAAKYMVSLGADNLKKGLRCTKPKHTDIINFFREIGT